MKRKKQIPSRFKRPDMTELEHILSLKAALDEIAELRLEDIILLAGHLDFKRWERKGKRNAKRLDKNLREAGNYYG